jgi:pectinesterase
MVAIFSAGVTLIALVQSASSYLLPPKGAITIGGKYGKYKTISAALNDTSSDVYFVYPGYVLDLQGVIASEAWQWIGITLRVCSSIGRTSVSMAKPPSLSATLGTVSPSITHL